MPSAFNVQYTAINLATSGNNTVVAAQTLAGVSKSIKIWGLFIAPGAAQNIQLFDGGGAITGLMTTLANLSSAFTLPIGHYPWWSLAPGNAFIINLSANTQISGMLVWSI